MLRVSRRGSSSGNRIASRRAKGERLRGESDYRLTFPWRFGAAASNLPAVLAILPNSTTAGGFVAGRVNFRSGYRIPSSVGALSGTPRRTSIRSRYKRSRWRTIPLYVAARLEDAVNDVNVAANWIKRKVYAYSCAPGSSESTRRRSKPREPLCGASLTGNAVNVGTAARCDVGALRSARVGSAGRCPLPEGGLRRRPMALREGKKICTRVALSYREPLMAWRVLRAI